MKRCVSCNEKWVNGYNFCMYCGYSPPHPSVFILEEKLKSIGITHPSQIRKVYLTKEENEIQRSYIELKHTGDYFFDDTGPETNIHEDGLFNFITHRISERYSLIIWPENADFNDYYEFDPFLPQANYNLEPESTTYLDTKNSSGKIEPYLDKIKQLDGVENVLLIQIDGNPISYTGVRLSKDEIINLGMEISSIFNKGLLLHPNDLNFIVIEGRIAKILIIPPNSPIHKSPNVINDKQFCIAITVQPFSDLKGIYQQTNVWLKEIKTALINSGESFTSSLAQFNEKENMDLNSNLSPYSSNLSENTSKELRKIMDKFSIRVKDLKYVCITEEKGIIASKIVKPSNILEENLNDISTVSYLLFQTANRCTWLLKKMNVDVILLDNEKSIHLIYSIGEAAFITEIGKTKQKVGLVRLMIPYFRNAVKSLLENIC